MPTHPLTKKRKRRAAHCLPPSERRCKSFCIRVTKAEHARVITLQKQLADQLRRSGLPARAAVSAAKGITYNALMDGVKLRENHPPAPSVIMDDADAARAALQGGAR